MLLSVVVQLVSGTGKLSERKVCLVSLDDPVLRLNTNTTQSEGGAESGEQGRVELNPKAGKQTVVTGLLAAFSISMLEHNSFHPQDSSRICVSFSASTNNDFDS